jgi:hypothetical protein
MNTSYSLQSSGDSVTGGLNHVDSSSQETHASSNREDGGDVCVALGDGRWPESVDTYLPLYSFYHTR